MIETESNTTTKNPVPWLTPMVVMWSTVIIVIALIVLGTWLNNRRAEAVTHDVRAAFVDMLEKSSFTAEQRAALEAEFTTTIDTPAAGDVRRENARRLFLRINQTHSANTIVNMTNALEGMVTRDAGAPGAPPGLAERWPAARLQCERVVFAVDAGTASIGIAAETFDRFIQKRKEWTPAMIDGFAADLAKIADKAKAPAAPPSFDYYESMRRALVEAREEK